MTFEDLLKLTRRQVVAIAVGLLAGLFVALTVILLTPVSYQASAEAYIRVNVSPDGEAANSFFDIFLYSNISTPLKFS